MRKANECLCRALLILLTLLISNTSFGQTAEEISLTVPKIPFVKYGSGKRVSCKNESFNIGSGITLKSHVFANGHSQITYAPALCYQNKMTVRVVANKPRKKVIAVLVYQKTSKNIQVSLYPKVSTKFFLQSEFLSRRMKPLDREGNPLSRSTYKYYPYNFEESNNYLDCDLTSICPRAAKPDMNVPGFYDSYAKKVIALYDQELSKILFSKSGNSYAAKFFKSRSVPSTIGDRVSFGFTLQANNGVLSQDFLIDSSLANLLDRKNFISTKGFNERIFQVHYRGWAREGHNLSEEELEKIARKLRGRYDSVILHTASPEYWIPEIFHRYGLKVYVYRFHSAAREISGGEILENYPTNYILRETRTGVNGEYYRGGNQSWINLDIRQERVRAQLIREAQDYIQDGWDGIFLDAPLIWSDPNSKVGGNGVLWQQYHKKRMSYVYAKWLTMWQLRKAMKSINSSAKLGVLAPSYHYDHLHVADYVIKESVFSSWRYLSRNSPYNHSSRLSLNFSTDNYKKNERWLVKNNFVVGNKSLNPLFNISAKYWMEGNNIKSTYTDLATLEAAYINSYLDIARDMDRYRQTIVKSVSPKQTVIDSLGVSLFRVDRDAKLSFNRHVPIVNYDTQEFEKYASTFTFQKGTKYIVAERVTNGWRWSKKHFAWKNNNLYIIGNIHFHNAPSYVGDRLIIEGYGSGDNTVIIRSPKAPTVITDGHTLNRKSLGQNRYQYVLPKGQLELEIKDTF